MLPKTPTLGPPQTTPWPHQSADDGGKPLGNPDSLAASHRHAQMLALQAPGVRQVPQVQLTCSIDRKGHVAIQRPEGLEPALWSAARICLDGWSAQNTLEASPSDDVIVIVPPREAPAASRYLEALNASVNLLVQLDLRAPEVLDVLTQFPGIVSLVEVNGPARFTLTGGNAGHEAPIEKITTTVIVQIATMMVEANQPAACCNLLAACGPKPKHLKALLLTVGAAPLVHWPGSQELLLGPLQQARDEILSEDLAASRELLGSGALPPWIRQVLSPQMPEDMRARRARAAAEVLLHNWISALREYPDRGAGKLLRNLLGVKVSDMSRLVDLARVLADEPLGDDFKEVLSAALAKVAHAVLGAAWGGVEAVHPFDFLTEIPAANADSPRHLRPLVQCVRIGILLGRAASLASWIPMLGDVENHNWSESAPELTVLVREIWAALFEAKKFVELDPALVQTLRRFDTKLRRSLGKPTSPEARFGWRSAAVLDRFGGREGAMLQFQQLVKKLSHAEHGALLGRQGLIEHALGQGLRREALGPVQEMSPGGQRAILDALLNSEDCREFLRWLADEAGYDVVRAVMVSLLGPTLHLDPAELYEILMALTYRDRFVLAVVLCPLVSMLQPTKDLAPKLVEVLLENWSFRADAPTLLFEACVGSPRHLDVSSWSEMLEVCRASTMFAQLMSDPALPQVLDASRDDLQRCIAQFLKAREGHTGERFSLFVVAESALRCAPGKARYFAEAAGELCRTIGFEGLLTTGAFQVFEALHGNGFDRWLRVMFSIHTGRSGAPRDRVVVQDLFEKFPENSDDKRLQAGIFESKLSPLPGHRLEDMTQREIDRLQVAFSLWLKQLGDDEHFVRACKLLVWQLIDAKASPATVSFFLSEMEETFQRRDWRHSRSAMLRKFRSEVEKARARAKDQEKTKRITVTLPDSLHADLRRHVNSLLGPEDDEETLARTIRDLIDAGLLVGELEILSRRSRERGLRDGIGRVDRLRALLFKPEHFDGRELPPEWLTWLGARSWQTSGPEFVDFLSRQFSDWTPAQWSMVDVEQLAAFMSGVLQSFLGDLGEIPNERNAKTNKTATTLIHTTEMLVLGPFFESSDSERVQRCQELLERLKARPGVRL